MRRPLRKQIILCRLILQYFHLFPISRNTYYCYGPYIYTVINNMVLQRRRRRRRRLILDWFGRGFANCLSDNITIIRVRRERILATSLTAIRTFLPSTIRTQCSVTRRMETRSAVLSYEFVRGNRRRDKKNFHALVGA